MNLLVIENKYHKCGTSNGSQTPRKNREARESERGGMKFGSRNPRYQVAEFLMPRGLYIGVGIRVSVLILIWLLSHQAA